MPLLDIQNISVQFGGLKAISNFSMSLETGSLEGLIGPNGAGKTTVFNVITGVVRKNDGKVLFDGKEIPNQMRPDRIAHLGIARTFQNIRLFSKMPVAENVAIALQNVAQYSMFDAFFKTPKSRRLDKAVGRQSMEYLEVVGLAEYADKIAGELPYGLQRRLEIARAIATKPKLLLLDEPAAGMNPEETAALADFIRKLHADHNGELSILLIEHHLDFVYHLCDRITVMNLGSKLATGTPQDIFNDEKVVKAYIGERRSRNE